MSPRGHQAASCPLSDTDCAKVPASVPAADQREWKIVWHIAIGLIALHIGAIYGAQVAVTKAMWRTNLFALLLYVLSGLGVTAGAHRYFSHKTYKARLPLRVMLTAFHTITFQGPTLCWARDHRMHHKYSDTDADPHNASRGVFFSHIGWLLVRKHPDFKAKTHTVDVSDLMADPVLRFQKKYYVVLTLLACFIVPTYVPTLWGESVHNAFFVCAVLRCVIVLNFTLFINSIAHKWGYKTYDKNIKPVDMKPLTLFVLGDSYHNYHHVFPWDYKNAEIGLGSQNLTKLFIDAMAKIGWAYDLRTVSAELVEKRVKRTGDGSHAEWGPPVHDTTVPSSA